MNRVERAMECAHEQCQQDVEASAAVAAARSAAEPLDEECGPAMNGPCIA